MADVHERTLDPRVPPPRILRRHPHDELTDLDQHSAPSGALDVRPLAGDQLAMPPEQRVGRRDRGNLAQGRTADSVRSRRESMAIVVHEPQPTSTNLMPQEPVLFDQVRDGVPLPASSHAVNTIRTICTAAGSITSRTLYHGWRERRRPTCGTERTWRLAI
jgi:hypothetical protein